MPWALTEIDPPTDIDTSSIYMSPPVFSPDVSEDNTPTQIVQQLPSGTTKVCGFFDYEGMTDGASWDATWSINGDFAPDYSLLAQEWIGGATGTNWWVCAGTGEQPLPDGSYELLKPRRGRRRSAQEELLFTLATPS